MVLPPINCPRCLGTEQDPDSVHGSSFLFCCLCDGIGVGFVCPNCNVFYTQESLAIRCETKRCLGEHNGDDREEVTSNCGTR
jgi:hypothetical protein